MNAISRPAPGRGRRARFTAFVGYLLGTGPATVTRVDVPSLDGVRLHVHAITGPPPDRQALPIVHGDRGPSFVVAARLVPIAGRSLGPTTHPFRSKWMLSFAVVARLVSPGCHPITGVALDYRVGDTTFHRATDGPASVSTNGRTC
jgi:hypothetical protein